MWRGTSGCSKGGSRLPSKDIGCNYAIPSGYMSAGYCECAFGRKVAAKGCGKARYLSCIDACLGGTLEK